MQIGLKRTLGIAGAAFAIALAFIPAGAQDYITLSKGGGVTGNTTIFRISNTGEVAKGSGDIEPAFTEFAQLRKGKTRKFFRKTRALIKAETFNYPGNMYTSIALVESGKEEKLVWGDGTHAAPVQAERLYQKIQHSLNRLTFHKDLRK